MKPLRDELELNLPCGKGVRFPAPVLPLPQFCEWLQAMHEDRVRRGVLIALSEDPRRWPVGEAFRLD